MLSETDATPNSTPCEQSLEAYNRVLTEIDAVPEAELRRINIDILGAVTTTLGALPKIKPFAESARRLTGFDSAAFAKLEDYARALAHAHGLYGVATAPPHDASAIVDQCLAAREFLVQNVRVLATAGLIEPNRVADMQLALGHRGVANDLAKLVAIVRERWSVIEGRSTLTTAKLKEYGDLTDKLYAAIGLREHATVQRRAVVERRQKAFTLFVKAYQEIRDGISYLRRKEGDVDEIIPSLYANRASRSVATAEPPSSARSPGSPPSAG